MRFLRVGIDWDKCEKCGFCTIVNTCHSIDYCIGCLSCYMACPHEARYIVEFEAEPKFVRVNIDGKEIYVPSGISVARALKYLGFELQKPGSKRQSLACKTGGCYACSVLINGELERSCIMPVKESMTIETNIDGKTPIRIIHGPEPHMVGGKATPWWEVDYVNYVEAAIWVAGCNLKCPQCQNYHVTYDNTSCPVTPLEAAKLVLSCHREYRTRGIAISGGEPTINRQWLVEFFKELSRLVKPGTRLHLDSNETVLTPDYIDELVEAGCNNIGVEPKCSRIETYMNITGMRDRELVSEYLDTAWKAIEYLREHYNEKVYLGVGLVYNKDLVAIDEIVEAGSRIASIDPNIQVTVLDYFPTFRRKWIKRPSVKEMLEIKKILEDQGLRNIIVQTKLGHVGPGNRNMGIVKYET